MTAPPTRPDLDAIEQYVELDGSQLERQLVAWVRHLEASLERIANGYRSPPDDLAAIAEDALRPGDSE